MAPGGRRRGVLGGGGVEICFGCNIPEGIADCVYPTRQLETVLVSVCEMDPGGEFLGRRQDDEGIVILIGFEETHAIGG